MKPRRAEAQIEKGWQTFLESPSRKEERANLGWQRRGERPYSFAPRIRTVTL